MKALPLTIAKPVRIAADLDGATAARLDRLAAHHDIPRAEMLRQLVRHALNQAEA